MHDCTKMFRQFHTSEIVLPNRKKIQYQLASFSLLSFIWNHKIYFLLTCRTHLKFNYFEINSHCFLVLSVRIMNSLALGFYMKSIIAFLSAFQWYLTYANLLVLWNSSYFCALWEIHQSHRGTIYRVSRVCIFGHQCLKVIRIVALLLSMLVAKTIIMMNYLLIL